MTELENHVTKDAYEGAIRSFTEAEIALREIVAGLQRFRTASDRVEGAGAALVGALAAVDASTGAVETAVSGLSEIAVSLAAATQVIAALEPARFWESFDRLEATTVASAVATQSSLGDGFAASERRDTQATAALDAGLAASRNATEASLKTATTALSAAVSTSTAQLHAAIVEASAARRQETERLSAQQNTSLRVATQARLLASVSAGLSAGGLVLLVMLLLR